MFNAAKLPDCCQSCLLRIKCNRHSVCGCDGHIVGCLDKACEKYVRIERKSTKKENVK